MSCSKWTLAAVVAVFGLPNLRKSDFIMVVLVSHHLEAFCPHLILLNTICRSQSVFSFFSTLDSSKSTIRIWAFPLPFGYVPYFFSLTSDSGSFKLHISIGCFPHLAVRWASNYQSVLSLCSKIGYVSCLSSSRPSTATVFYRLLAVHGNPLDVPPKIDFSGVSLVGFGFL